MPATSGNYLSILFLTVCWIGIQMNMAFDETQFPRILDEMVNSPFLIGIVLTTGPLSGIIIQPLFGWYSDRLEKLGISRLNLILAASAGAIAFILWLPHIRTFWMFVAALGLYYVFMNILIVVTRAFNMEASNTPRLIRYKGSISGIISLFSGMGAFLMYLVASRWGGTPVPFIVGATVLLVTTALFLRFTPRPGADSPVAEPPSPALFSGWNLVFYLFPPLSLIPAFERRIVQQPYQQPIFRLFLVVYLAWFGFQAIRAFFFLYARNHLHFTEAWANYLLAAGTLSVMICSVPLGRLGDKTDNTRLFKYFLLLYALICLGFYYFVQLTSEALILSILLGAGLAGIMTYQLSILFKLCPSRVEGIYTGLYNVFISVPQLHSLLLTGWLIELLDNYNAILLVGAISTLSALILAYRLPPVHPRPGDESTPFRKNGHLH